MLSSCMFTAAGCVDSCVYNAEGLMLPAEPLAAQIQRAEPFLCKHLQPMVQVSLTDMNCR